MFMELPLELHTSIIGHVHQYKDLRALALTCRGFREEAQRALYHSPDVHIRPSKDQQRSPFLESVTSSPERLALMVRRITISVHVSWELSRLRGRAERHRQSIVSEMEELTDWIEKIGEWLRTTLPHMVGITHLRLSYDADDTQLHPTWISSLLEICTFQLKTLVWQVDNTDIKTFINKNLKQQQNLQVLKLGMVQQFDDDSETDNLLGRFCPGLLAISAPWPVFRAILRHNRKIPYLEYNGGVFTSWTSSIDENKEYPHVKHLWWMLSLKSLNIPISSFINLVLLHVLLLKDEDYILIASLKHLEILIVIRCPDSDAISTSRRLFTGSASLIRVYYQIIDLWSDLDPTHACHTYERTIGEVLVREIYNADELKVWRHFMGLDFSGGPL